MITYKLVTVNVVFNEKKDEVLMIQKRRNMRNFSSEINSVGKDKWNSSGGKVEPNEDFTQGAIRETQEETGIISLNPVPKIGLNIEWPGQNLFNVIFLTTQYEGQLKKIDEECIPQWVPKSQIPYNKMFNTDREWFPHVFDKQFYVYDIKGQLANNDIISTVTGSRQVTKNELENLLMLRLTQRVK